MNITRKAALGGFAMIGSVALLAGCTSGGSTEPAASDFMPCMVSDFGGFDDNSFNQLGFEGATAAAEELGVELTAVESKAETDFAGNLESLVSQGCDVIVSVGFQLSAATVESALANPDVQYILIDDAGDNDFDGVADAPNVKPLLFNTAEAAFLAGYAAAATTQTGTVGTFGGMNFPTVAIFMDGFKQGVDYYNEENGADVTLLGWDGTDGSFTGGFEANDDARQVAQSLLDQNADIILPVGGPIYQSAAAAITDSGNTIALLGVDADFTVTAPDIADMVFTSILKKIDVATKEAVLEAGKGNFDATAYVGTLENGGVGVAKLTNFKDWMPSDLQATVDGLAEQIIAGEIKVTSYLAK